MEAPHPLRSGEMRNNIDVKLHPYANITQMDRATLPTSLPAGYYGVGPGLFSPEGRLIAFALGDPAPEQAWLYDRVSRRTVNITGGREINGSVVFLQMAWIGDTLYVQTGNTASQRHFFVATATSAKEIHVLPPEAVDALKRQQDAGVGSALNSARVNRSVVKAENQGSGLFNLFMEELDGQYRYPIANGYWELESFVVEPARSSILYLETFQDWVWGDSHDGAIVMLDLNTRQSQETYLPARAEKLLAAVQEGDGYLAAYTTDGPREPEVLLSGGHQAVDFPQNICFAKVPISASR